MQNVNKIEKELLLIVDSALEYWSKFVEKENLSLIRNQKIHYSGTPGKRDYTSEITVKVFESNAFTDNDDFIFLFDVFLFFKGKPKNERDIEWEISAWISSLFDSIGKKPPTELKPE